MLSILDMEWDDLNNFWSYLIVIDVEAHNAPCSIANNDNGSSKFRLYVGHLDRLCAAIPVLSS